VPVDVEAVTKVEAIPWYVWCSVIAVTSAAVGGYWDISWHRSIGRDTFWTPAHIAIYLCGVLAGVSCLYLVLSLTFGNASSKEPSVSIWGFKGPLGAFISAWGGIAMLTSAPFDNWWHNAYGLDVEIVSPPHVLLIAGILAVQAGALILILGRMNRAEPGSARRLNTFFLYVGGMIVLLLQLLVMEYTWRGLLHGVRAYQVISLAIPFVLVAVASASGQRWGGTFIAAIYTAFLLGQLWILPLFPAQPKLGPVYQNVTHFIPWDFPLWLLVPAVLLDLLRPRIAKSRFWIQAILMGCVFLVSLVLVQWPFATFLMTPAARNWFFGAHYLEYNFPPSWHPFEFFAHENTRSAFWTGMTLALAYAILSTRVGLAWAEWMKRIRR
jgi:hypothetical protein